MTAAVPKEVPSAPSPVPDEAPSAPQPALENGDPWQDARARAIAATFVVLSDPEFYVEDHYENTVVVAFYIGNDEWISVGSADPSVRLALRQGGIASWDFFTLADDLRPVTVIGYDPATKLSLLRASGAGVTPLRFADHIPAPCALLETLARFRPDLAVVAGLREIEGADAAAAAGTICPHYHMRPIG